MNTYTVLIILSILVIFSYLFDLFARRAKIPSVLLLLGLGAILRQATTLLEIQLPRLDPAILLNVKLVSYGIGLVAMVYLTNCIYLKLTAKEFLSPAFFIIPISLIRVLLFLGIPSTLKLETWAGDYTFSLCWKRLVTM